MSGVARPRGPLPARVYWFRRLLVLSVALALVLGIKSLLGQAPQDPGAPSARQVSDVTTVEPAEPTATADAPVAGGSAEEATSQPGKRKGKRAKKNTPPPLPEPKGVCLDPDVRITPKVEGASAGGGVRIDLQLTSSLSEACTWTVSPKTVVVKLTSGSDRIWSSQECPRAIPTEDVIVRRDTPAVVSMTWNGRRSDTGCTGNTQWALLPGYYHVLTAAYGGTPVDVQFRLRRPQAPVITKTVKPKKPKAQAKPQQQKKKKKRQRQQD